MRAGAVLIALTLVWAVRCQPPPPPPRAGDGVAEAALPVAAATMLGAWSGQWTAPPGRSEGAVELVLARGTGDGGVLGHFTFVTGGKARTMRYEGRIEDGALRFPLVGDGRIVLEPREGVRPGAAATLRGEWVDAGGVLPAPNGLLELSRAPVR